MGLGLPVSFTSYFPSGLRSINTLLILKIILQNLANCQAGSHPQIVTEDEPLAVARAADRAIEATPRAVSSGAICGVGGCLVGE
jgi:hypothetical protein